MDTHVTRRKFLKQSALTAASLSSVGYFTSTEARASSSPNEKLNLGIIGCWHRGAADAAGVRSENFAALCDIDDRYFGEFVKRFPEGAKAKRYNDWRRLLDDKTLDGVVIATTDHHHALAAVHAMQLGKHVYCEKPLAHSVFEARRVREVYRECRLKLATQMGTQIHATENYRRVVELIQGGAIGPVHEAHVWCSRTIKPLEKLTGKPPVPDYLHWDLWLGPAPWREYHPEYLPGNLNWNRRWDFGNGVVGDMGSHLIDLPWWALNLRVPRSVAAEGPSPDPEKNPEWLIVTWKHGPRPGNPNFHVPVTVKWYHGGKKPELRPQVDVEEDLTKWFNGILFIGEKGMLLADYGRRVLLPKKDFKDYEPPPPTIPSSLGHYKEWIEAAKGRGRTLCNFEYSGSLIEHNLLGNVAFRAGEELNWNPRELKAVNCPKAENFIRREYRKGWTI